MIDRSPTRERIDKITRHRKKEREKEVEEQSNPL